MSPFVPEPGMGSVASRTRLPTQWRISTALLMLQKLDILVVGSVVGSSLVGVDEECCVVILFAVDSF